MKKIIIVLAILLGFWFYKNPIGYISSVKPGLIIYSGIPILNMDLLVLPNGHFLLQSKTFSKITLSQNMKDPVIDRLGGGKGRPEIFVIGQGMNPNELFPIDEKLINFFSSWNIQLYYGYTPDMVKKFNELKKNKKKVMGYFVTGKPSQGILY